MDRFVFVLVLITLVQLELLADKQHTYRLSRDVLPKHYSLKLHPDMDKGTFTGEVTITVYSNKAEETIILHSTGLNITHATVDQLPAIVAEEDYERISIKFDDGVHFQPGEHLIYLKYSGKLGEEFGLRKAAYQYNSQSGFLIVNEFEPNHARKAFPCFDEPLFKAQFSVRLITPNDTYKAISNMPEIAHYPSPSGIIYDFQTSVMMSTYLVSLAITDYSYYEEILEYGTKKVPIRVYTYNASEENNHHAIEGAKNAIKFYSDYTGLDYPLPKLDMIEYDKGSISATETWGLIQFKQGLLTTNLKIYDNWQCLIVVYHELGHFWFGNLVTNDWWNDLWLQEGIATFMSYKLMTKLDKTDISSEIRLTDLLEIDDTEGIPQLVGYLNTTDHIERRFDRNVYTKAAFLLKALEVLIGEEPFQQAIKTFLKNHAFRTVTTNDFIMEFEKQVPHINVRSFLESYIYQPGYPVVNVDDSSGNYVVKQIQKEGESHKWTIPISYKYETNKTGILWLDKDIETVEMQLFEDSNWVLFNTVEIPGLYIVHYTGKLWEKIINQLQDIPSTEIRNIAENVAVLYHLKYINCDVVLQLLGKLKSVNVVSLFKTTMNMAKAIACSEPEFEILVNYLNEKFDSVRFLLLQFNATCSESRRNTILSDSHTNHCIQWIRQNLAAAPANSV